MIYDCLIIAIAFLMREKCGNYARCDRGEWFPCVRVHGHFGKCRPREDA